MRLNEREKQWPRTPLPPAANDDLDARMRRVEERLAGIEAGLQYLVMQAREQALFRTRIMWAAGMAITLLVLQSIGLEVSVSG